MEGLLLNCTGIPCVSDCNYMRLQLFLGVFIFFMEFISLSLSFKYAFLKGRNQQTLSFKCMNKQQIIGLRL